MTIEERLDKLESEVSNLKYVIRNHLPELATCLHCCKYDGRNCVITKRFVRPVDSCDDWEFGEIS